MSISYNALTGALAAQSALNTSSQNIANLQTKGYTRQGVLLAAVQPDAGSKLPGNGVQVSSLLRFSDSYKTQQMWRANSDLGARTQVQPYLTQMERVMNDKLSSISAGVDQFFKALNAAGVDPTSTPLRQQVVTAAGAMSQHFNSIYNVTANQLISIQQQRDAILPQINSTLQGIAALNNQITAVGVLGTNTSALIDKRDQLIDGLANQVALEVNENPDGSRSVSLKSGQPLVVGNIAGSMTFDTSAGTPVLTLNFANTPFTLDDTKVGGQLGGLGDYMTNTLKPLQKSIADMANQLSTKVNAQLAGGFDANGNPGAPLLVYNPASATGLLETTPGIQAADLAFSSDGMPGDSGNLQQLIDIKNQSVNLTSIGTVLLGDADTQLVGKLGIDSAQNKSLLNTATTIRQQAEDDWKSTSGVNSDEEAINLVEYQNMYQANMKVISVANTLFDATLHMFG
ncbi:flagellar hook-associated protein FlgK [Rugamonas apoptosis]|uniref:Flagellar hook-associated protein 1 n=1 Tax=Rugamonas apoptosis TaxID=2758570 RepID=A0A7W2FC22_9BURK|nr:flagellar hook-associated protein FlgK [Rugamonas apoptosis]MBA5688839.1 flagellar hook-associated protein FlgK [Rugamonas apoptosis]